MPQPMDEYNEANPEPGLESEGYFDVIKPYKQALINKFKGYLPEGTQDTAAKIADIVLPDSPLPMAGLAASELASPALGVMNKLGKLGEINEAQPGEVINKGIRSVADKFKTRADVDKSKQEANTLLEQLGIKPKPSAPASVRGQ